ncbi:MAG: amidohydrolase family protein, partial [Sphingomonadales bacterium]
MGVAQRAPTHEELEAMKALVREGMEMGAVGLSAGLMYEPGMFSDTEELTALAREVAPYGGIYDSHSRNPVAGLLESEQETIEIATAAGIPARLAHLKAVGLINRDKTRDLIALVEAARADGHVVVSDQYPYDGAATALLEDLLVFPDAQDTVGRFRDVREIRDGLDAAEDLSAIRHATEQGIDGGFSWVKAVGYGSMRIVDAPDAPDLVGENLELLAAARGIEPFDLLISLIQGHDAAIMITLGAIEEREVQELMVQPWNMIASDGAHVTLDGRSRARHPRSTGSFARVLGHYVRDLELLTLPEAIRKMSSFPADHLGLHDRGRIAVGKVADIAVFNPATVRDRSTWTEPHDFAEGVRHVLVNGVVAVSDGRVTGELAGTYVKRQNGTGK